MGKPIIHGPAYSTYVRTTRMTLEEKGVVYDLREFDFMQGMPEEDLKRHPFGKVPAFEHDGFMLYETAAIARYVDEAFDGPALQPADVRARARMAQIVGILDSYTYGPVVGQIVIQRLVVPMMNGTPDEAAITAALPAAAPPAAGGVAVGPPGAARSSAARASTSSGLGAVSDSSIIAIRG